MTLNQQINCTALPPPTPTSEHGFTLFELLTVVAILSIFLVITLATISFDSKTEEEKLQTQVYKLLDNATTYAINYNKFMRVVIDDISARVYVEYQDSKDSKWKSFGKIPPLQYANRGEEIISNYASSYVLIYPSGRRIVENFVLNTDTQVVEFDLERLQSIAN